RIEGCGCSLPSVGKFSPRQRQPVMCHRVVGDVAAIERNGLAIEDIGERLVCSGGIAERAGRQRESADKIFIQFTVDTEAHADTRTIAILHAQLVVMLTSDAHVPAETKSSYKTFQPGNSRTLGNAGIGGFA